MHTVGAQLWLDDGGWEKWSLKLLKDSSRLGPSMQSQTNRSAGYTQVMLVGCGAGEGRESHQ